MSAAILSIGTELTRGEIVNTNAAWLSEELTRLGLDVTAVETIPDDPLAIRRVLLRLGADHDVVVSTGGLGPTTDDITSECAANAMGVPLERDPASLEAIRTRMERFGRTVAASNAKQADFPRGATVLPNAQGTAPGFVVTIGRARAFFMPGVPGEMKPMFASHVAPALSGLSRGGIHQVRLRTFGLPESTANDRLAGVEAAHGVIIGYRAHYPEIEVKVLARRGSQEEAERAARDGAEDVCARLGDVVYAEGDASLAETVGGMLRDRGLTIATAESCTGGLVAELLTDPAGASAWVRGAIVAYDNRVKMGCLGVPEATLAAHGAVSAEVARAMAEGARRALGADVALAITGIAGPTGGTAEKPIGLVYFAVSSVAGTSDRRVVFPGARRQIRAVAAWSGLAMVRRVLRDGHDGAV